MIVLTRRDVLDLLQGREEDVIEAVRQAYIAHTSGESALPHSVFLRFPHDARSRIIGLPAYLGGMQPAAGIKWIASFPANVDAGLERASAVMILNCLSTGRPLALLEASVISARRTAASAVLAARLLAAGTDEAAVTLLGCGVINFEILRFLAHARPRLSNVVLYDLDSERAKLFRDRCGHELPRLAVRIESSPERASEGHSLVSVATTAPAPYLDTRSLQPGSLVLHVSLRDVLPDAVLAAVNVVDDPDHVCREGTSLHLAEQQVGHRGFIASAIGELASTGRDPDRVTIFSPFGLGILDLAVAGIVMRDAEKQGRGTRVEDFTGGDEGQASRD